MYHIHSVAALVYKNRPRGEADALVEIITDGMGFLFASAKGIRHAKSKSRYAVQELSFIQCELVRGKETWRLIKAQPVCSVCAMFPAKTVRIIAKVARLIARICDEEVTAAPYRAIKTMVTECEKGTDPELAEIVATMVILSSLGYINVSAYAYVLDAENRDFMLIQQKRNELVREINRAIKAATS